MKKSYSIILLMLFPILVMAQASGGQITHPAKKQQNTQQTGKKSTNNSPKQKVVREITYESTLSAEERRIWEDEKAKAKEDMKQLAYNLKSQGLEIRGNFNDGMARCSKKDKSFCFINKLGKILFTLSPSVEVESFHNGYAKFKIKKDNKFKYGVINKKGIVIINAEYDWIGDYNEGVFQAKKDDKNGFINRSREIIIPFVYNSAGDFHEGLATVNKDGKWGYIDKSNNLIIPFEYDGAKDFSEGLAPVMKKGVWGYINKSNTLVIPYSYWLAYPFQFGLGQVITNTDRVRTGFINNQGKYVIPLHNGNLGDFSDNLIEINGSYLDNLGKLQIRTKYDLCCDFSEGLAFVGKISSTQPSYKYKCGFINKKGQIVIDFKFTGHADSNPIFQEGLAWITTNGGGFVDKYGNSTFDY